MHNQIVRRVNFLKNNIAMMAVALSQLEFPHPGNTIQYIQAFIYTYVLYVLYTVGVEAPSRNQVRKEREKMVLIIAEVNRVALTPCTRVEPIT